MERRGWSVPRSTQELVDLVTRRGPALAFEISEPLARFLREARALCGGDLDKALIMVEIILRASQHPQFRRLDAAELNSTRSPDIPSLGINVRSLAESTGIPRESVRRKVRELLESGWVVRQGHRLHFSHEGYVAVTRTRQEMQRMYVRAYQVVSALIETEDDTDGLRSRLLE